MYTDKVNPKWTARPFFSFYTLTTKIAGEKLRLLVSGNKRTNTKLYTWYMEQREFHSSNKNSKAIICLCEVEITTLRRFHSIQITNFFTKTSEYSFWWKSKHREWRDAALRSVTPACDAILSLLASPWNLLKFNGPRLYFRKREHKWNDICSKGKI